MKLATKVAVWTGLLALLASVALVWWIGHEVWVRERASFADQARANAAFIGRSGLPPGARLASDLGDVLGLEVSFVRSGADVGGDTSETWVEAVPLKPGWTIVFVRPAFRGLALVWREALIPLLAVWGAAALVGAALARGVVRPLRDLAQRFPDRLDGAEALRRGDEIGDLARTLHGSVAELDDERRRRESAERHALLGRMATSLAHEIRNPIAAIRLHGQLVERACAGGASGGAATAPTAGPAGSAEMIIKEAAKIENLVNQWMFLARPEPPATARVDVRDVVAGVLRSAAPALAHAGVKLETALGDRPLWCDADAVRIDQALGNLVRNAVHAMPEGGTLHVSARGTGGVEVVLEDSGAGFSDEALARFGEAFHSTKEGGMGIGLSVAMGVAEAHGGRLVAENRDGGGATVILHLPEAGAAPRQTAP